MPSYKISNGEFLDKSIIDRKVNEAKKQVIAEQLDKFGYNHCSICKRNDCKPIDAMHVLSVDSCQKMGMSDLAWHENNILPVGRNCHRQFDKCSIGGVNETDNIIMNELIKCRDDKDYFIKTYINIK